MSQAKSPAKSAAPRAKTAADVDFLIIGAGAAGGVLAKELSVAGFRVVVLEQGPHLLAKDFAHDEIKVNWESQLINDWKKQPNTFRKTENEKAATQPAVGDYRIFPLGLPASANGLCGNSTCVINMAVLWDTQIINTSLTAGELITVKYHFRDTYNATGSCTFTVSPDLSVAVGP